MFSHIYLVPTDDHAPGHNKCDKISGNNFDPYPIVYFTNLVLVFVH